MDFQLVPRGVSPLNIESLAKFSDNLKARDKLLRLLQYNLKFWVFRMLQHTGHDKDLLMRLQTLSTAIALHRKAFKLGGWIEEVNKLFQAAKGKISGFRDVLNLILRPTMMMFLMVDNIVYFATLKVLNIDKDSTKAKAYKLRLTSAVLQALIGFMDISEQSNKIDNAKRSGKHAETLREKQGQLLISTTKAMLDVITYMNSAKYISVNDGHIGLIGSMSSVAALYQLWCK